MKKLNDNSSNINHPKHYNNGNIECIDAMESTFGETAVMDFCLLNAFKYLWRANSKNGKDDIKKAQWYLDKYIELYDCKEFNEPTQTDSELKGIKDLETLINKTVAKSNNKEFEYKKSMINFLNNINWEDIEK